MLTGKPNVFGGVDIYPETLMTNAVSMLSTKLLLKQQDLLKFISVYIYSFIYHMLIDFSV